MSRVKDHAPGRVLARWVGGAHRFAGWVIAAAAASTVAILFYIAANLGINTDTADMIDENLPFRQAVKDYDRAFPHAVDTLLVVIDGATPDLAEDAATVLAERLRGDGAIFKSVYQPGGEAFFQRNGLLYLDSEALADLADNLAEVQPLIGKLSQDPSLRGLFGVLRSALEEPEAEGFDLTAAFDRLNAATVAALEDRPYHLSWRAVFSGDDEADINDRRAFLVVQPNLDFSDLQPQKQALDAVRGAIDELGLTAAKGLRIRLTGSVALNYAQLDSARAGAELAGPLSFVMVGLILFIGLRSWRLVVSALVTLICGLIWTAGFATLAIGELNLISIAFAVLFISLGAAFSIHMCLRYQELIGQGQGQNEAVTAAGREVGGALFLCAATTAAGFYVFIPTDYTGVSELGLIAGTGMFICLLANFTVLPAMLGILPVAKRAPAAKASRPAGGETLPRYRRAVRIGAVIVALAAIPPVIAARFDFNPLNLHDPTAESVQTLQDLLAESERPPWSVDVLAADLAEAEALAERIAALDGVYQTLTIADYVPSDQAEKLAIIEDMAFFMGQPPKAPMAPPDAAQRRASLADFRRALERWPGADPSAGRLAGNLARLIERNDAAALLATIEASLLDGFPERLRRLYMALEPIEPVTFEDLPESLKSREIAADGRVRVQVFPTDDLTDNAALRRFVGTVRSVAPSAVGSPISILESGDAVVGAFIQALISAVAAVVVLVLVLMRRLIDVVFVVTPLLLAALLTIAASTLFGLPFNFANVIVLPVLFGVGVDSAIHLVYRYRTDPASRANILSTSTARGVVFSALTTIAGFGSLAVSTHRGTASMGELLTIGVVLSMVCTLLVLPALLPRDQVN